MHKSYTILMSLELGLIEIKYQGSGSHTTKNPFQQPSPPSMLIFLTAIFGHALACTADMSLPTTKIIFHFSGVVGCEALLWILLTEFWWWYLINLFLLLVTSFCFLNCVDDISKRLCLFRGSQINDATHLPNLESHEAPV